MIPIKDKYINKFYSERNSGRIRMEEKKPKKYKKKNIYVHLFTQKHTL